ncbi:4-hydroxy-tetrahydrodipicolinate reductase [Elusimicrobiota bacterium]
MIRMCVSGGRGKMGRILCARIMEHENVELASILEQSSNEDVGHEINGIQVLSDAETAVAASDVVIDFSTPDNSIILSMLCAELGKKLVVCTTGLSDEQIKKLEKAALSVPVILSPNTSIGVNTVFKIIKKITSMLPEYEKEIIEAHHNQKKDAPSGTAVKMAEIMSAPNDSIIYGREGQMGIRPGNEIAVHAVRGGNIIGEHTAMWIGPNDRIELTHRAQSRALFADGAIKAAVWIERQAAGKLFSMEDVLE